MPKLKKVKRTVTKVGDGVKGTIEETLELTEEAKELAGNALYQVSQAPARAFDITVDAVDETLHGASRKWGKGERNLYHVADDAKQKLQKHVELHDNGLSVNVGDHHRTVKSPLLVKEKRNPLVEFAIKHPVATGAIGGLLFGLALAAIIGTGGIAAAAAGATTVGIGLAVTAGITLFASTAAGAVIGGVADKCQKPHDSLLSL